MSEAKTDQSEAPVNLALEQATRIKQALVYLATAVELELVSESPPEKRENLALLAGEMGEIGVASYMLLSDLSGVTGIAVEPRPAISGQGTKLEVARAKKSNLQFGGPKPPEGPKRDLRFESNQALDEAIRRINERYKGHPEGKKETLPYRELQQNTEDSYEDPRDSLLFKEAHNYKLLTPQSEKKVFGKIDAGLALYQKLSGDLENLSPKQEQVFISMAAAYQVAYTSNLRLVLYWANRFGGHNDKYPFSDRVQAGNIGLLTSVNRFEVTRGNRFSSFASPWIRRDISREAKRGAHSIYMPDSLKRMNRTSRQLEQQLKRSPTHQELAIALQITPQELAQLKLERESRTATSLNAPAGRDNDSSTEKGDLIPDPASIDTETEVDHFANKQKLAEVFKQCSLKPRSLLILSLRFGVYVDTLANTVLTTVSGKKNYDALMQDVTGDLSYEEIADILGITPFISGVASVYTLRNRRRA